MTYRILDKTDLSRGLQDQATELFRLLNPAINPIPLDQVLTDDDTVILVGCLNAGQLVGMACMARYRVVSGDKGWIEDVVVHSGYRGKGIGRSLMELLLQRARELGLTEVLLFTGKQRLPAIGLYETLGFHRKESHLYQLKFPRE